MTMHSARRAAGGFVLLEALIGLLIFSIGILALVAMQAESIRNTTEAKYRNDAAYLANQIIGRMWADRGNLANYAHRPGGTPCSPTGAASTNARRQAWLLGRDQHVVPLRLRRGGGQGADHHRREQPGHRGHLLADRHYTRTTWWSTRRSKADLGDGDAATS